jgi:hypothetical protein
MSMCKCHYAECHCAECPYAECDYAESRCVSVIMLSVAMQRAVMLSVMALWPQPVSLLQLVSAQQWENILVGGSFFK